MIEISIIGTTLTISDKSLTEGGDLDRSKVELQHHLWGIAPSLSPPHVWDLLEALWIDVSAQSAPRLIGRLSGSSVQLQIDINGLSFSCSGLSPWDLRPPGLDLLFFFLNKAQAASSKLVRAGIEVLLLLYCVIVYYSRIKKLWRQYLWCNSLHVWMVIVKCL